MAGTDFSHLTNDELIKGIKALDLPDYIRSKAYGIDVRETLAQMTEMLMQLAYNQGMDPQQAKDWVSQLNNKIVKGQVTMSDLTQEVKEALTGGAVAVVGVDAVGTENIKENAVMTSKIADGSVTIGKLSESFKREVQDLIGGTYKKLYNTSKKPASSSEQENYILINQPTLTSGVVYSLEIIPNETFTQDVIQLGTSGSSSAMVDNVSTNVSFVTGTSYWVDDYVPSEDNLGYMRVLGNAQKIDKVNVYVYANDDGRVDAIEDEVTDIKKDLYGREVKEFKQSAQRPEGTIEPPNYWRVADPYLSKGTRYALEFIPNETFTQDVIQLGPTALSAEMIDTIATNVEFQAGVPYWVEEYIPSAEELDYIRVLNNAFKLDKINIYTYEMGEGALANTGGDSETEYHLAHKINKNVKEFRELRNSIDGSLSSLVQVKQSEGITKNVSLPSVGKRDKYILRVGLHYGTEQFTPSAEEIFLDGQSNTDFSDVRFFDSQGNMLKASLGKSYNADLLEDSNLDKMLKHTSDGKMIGYENARGIVISEDSGVTWNAITGTHNVTTNASAVYSRTSMYPVFVDSQDNIYAYAGGILYKLLASDNYATKKQVLDFSWDNNGSTVYPDIQDHAMDESRNGQLLVGADYQTQYRSRITAQLTVAKHLHYLRRVRTDCTSTRTISMPIDLQIEYTQVLMTAGPLELVRELYTLKMVVIHGSM